MADLSVVMDKLQGFETADDIAEYFRDYGILAQPRNSMACAVTKFISDETGMFHIGTNSSSVVIYNEAGMANQDIPHTKAMVEFVLNYDTGHYPFLVEKGFEVPRTGIALNWEKVAGCPCGNCK